MTATQTAISAAGGGPQRRRGAALENAILGAAYDELTTVGYTNFSYESVAARARTGKSSIYRRWPRKAQLVMDAMCIVMPQPADCGFEPVFADEVTTVQALHQIAADVARMIASPAGDAIRAIKFEATVDPELAKLVDERFQAPRRAALLSILRRGVARGEVRPGAATPLVADVLPAVLVHRMVMGGEKLSEATVVEIIDQVLVPLVAMGWHLPFRRAHNAVGVAKVATLIKAMREERAKAPEGKKSVPTSGRTSSSASGCTTARPPGTTPLRTARYGSAGADVVIVSCHSGADTSPSHGDARPRHENASSLLAEQVPGIHAVLVGHAHVEIPQRYVTNARTGMQVQPCEPYYGALSCWTPNTVDADERASRTSCTAVADDQQFVVTINNYRQSRCGGFPGVTTAPVVHKRRCRSPTCWSDGWSITRSSTPPCSRRRTGGSSRTGNRSRSPADVLNGGAGTL